MSEGQLDETVHQETCLMWRNLRRNKETDCHVFAAPLAPQRQLNVLKICILSWVWRSSPYKVVENLEIQYLQLRFWRTNMSCEVYLEHQRKADLRAETSPAPAFAPHVPTVMLISHRDLRDKHGAHRLHLGSLDSSLVTRNHYRHREGRSLSS